MPLLRSKQHLKTQPLPLNVLLRATLRIVRELFEINVFKGWNHLGMDEFMSDKAKKMKA